MGIEWHFAAHESDSVRVVTFNRNETVLQPHLFLTLAEIDPEMQVFLAPAARHAGFPSWAEWFTHADSLTDFDCWHPLEVRV